VAKIIRLLERSGATTGYHIYRLFDKALQVWEALSTDPLKVDMDHWLNDVCVGIERGLGPLEEAYWELLESASYGYEDILGSVYMELWISNGKTGQFFTPIHLARAMAEMTLCGLAPLSPGDAPYKLYDPSCGSGVMLLAAMEYFEVHWPHMLDADLVQFYGQDIDATCCTMAKLNLRFHRAGRMLRHELESGGDRQVSLDSHGALVPALAVADRVRVRCADTLSQEEVAQVAAALDGQQPTEESLFPDLAGVAQAGAAPPFSPLQQGTSPAGGNGAQRSRRVPANVTGEHGEHGEYRQPQLFVTQLPLPGDAPVPLAGQEGNDA
jgi:hypothetical protein